MRIAIMQPTYLPWMGYFDLIDRCDLFVILDDVQFEYQSWQHRNRIKTANGINMLTLPVHRANSVETAITEVTLSYRQNWQKKHLAAIQQSYSKSAFYKSDFKASFDNLYQQKWEKLASFNVEVIEYIMKKVGIDTQLVLSSTLKLKGTKTQRVINICKALKVTEYLSPVGAFDYIEEDNLFPKNDIQLYYQHFEHPKYSQLYGDF
ncbi:MAG: WbqC family protein, partial [Chitinophagales bacterium]